MVADRFDNESASNPETMILESANGGISVFSNENRSEALCMHSARELNINTIGEFYIYCLI